MTFSDYENLEKITNAWFEDDKLRATGWVTDKETDLQDGNYVNGVCKNLHIDEDDRIVHGSIGYTRDGVNALEF